MSVWSHGYFYSQFLPRQKNLSQKEPPRKYRPSVPEPALPASDHQNLDYLLLLCLPIDTLVVPYQTFVGVAFSLIELKTGKHIVQLP